MLPSDPVDKAGAVFSLNNLPLVLPPLLVPGFYFACDTEFLRAS